MSTLMKINPRWVKRQDIGDIDFTDLTTVPYVDSWWNLSRRDDYDEEHPGFLFILWDGDLTEDETNAIRLRLNSENADEEAQKFAVADPVVQEANDAYVAMSPSAVTLEQVAMQVAALTEQVNTLQALIAPVDTQAPGNATA